MKNVVQIPLNRGKYALVDTDKAHLVLDGKRWQAVRNGRVWYATRGAGTKRARRTEQMHRLLIGAGPGQHVDHINGDGLDNRLSNLRICTNQNNLRSQRARVGCSSRFKGVAWNKQKRKWVANICVDYKLRSLGVFTDEIEAAKAYDAAARDTFGEFAAVNFPRPGERGALEGVGLR